MTWEPNAVDASLIATVAALLGVLITNQGKISEFRQKWIDELREDAATLITHTLMIHAATGEEDLDESYIQVHQTTARIQLRLNPKEKRTLAIIAAMNEMREANHVLALFDEMNQRIDTFTKAMQRALKKEWRRVKWGEPLYRGVFVLAIVAVLLSVLAFLHQNFNWHIPLIPGLN